VTQHTGVPIEKGCVDQSQTIMEAMRVIDASAWGIALVLDESRRLVGTLSDGDIRRALLNGATLEFPLAPYIRRQYQAVGPEAGRAEVLDLMQALRMRQIPVVDTSGRLLGIHLLHELIGAVERPNWGVLMAGGKGTRLHPITEHLPKPMIRVAGRPIIERLVLHMVSYGIRRIFITIHYLGHVIEEHLGDGSRFGCRIDYIREAEPLGTGGALALLPESPRHPVVVLNGDLVTQANIDQLLALHHEGGYVATIGLRRYFHQVPFGCVDLEGGLIRRIEEKPVISRLINAGLYVLSPEVVERVPQKFFLITELFEDCLEREERVGAFEIDNDWIDVGQHEQLRKAREGTYWHDQVG